MFESFGRQKHNYILPSHAKIAPHGGARSTMKSAKIVPDIVAFDLFFDSRDVSLILNISVIIEII